jgi:hypothetical protein
MRFGPKIAALATVLALPLGATVFANALADGGPPSAPGDVRVGSDPSPAGRQETTSGPTTPSPTTTAPPVNTAPQTTVVPPPPPVSDDDDNDDGSGGDDDGDDG